MNDDEQGNEDQDEISALSSREDEEFEVAILGAAHDFDSSLKATLPGPDYKKLRTIGAFIMRGLTLEESCVLARVDPKRLGAIAEQNPDVKSFIVFKQISFKAGLLGTLSVAGIGGKQAKIAGYLLEKKYPKEYDIKKGDDDAREPDAMERAMEYVRENSEMQPLVKRLN